MLTFREVATAAYCPRKLYYRRRSSAPDDDIPDRVHKRRRLAFVYPELLTGVDQAVADNIVRPISTVRERLAQARDRLDCWDAIVDPAGRDVHVRGKDCRGLIHKLLATDPPMPSLVFTGTPPENGVWEPQSVRLVAAAKALSWKVQTSIDRAVAEYPAHGVIRQVSTDGGRAGPYRRALRTARTIDGPPARTQNRKKCSPCEYRSECGVRVRSGRSLLSR